MIEEFDELATGTGSVERATVPPEGLNTCIVVEAARRKNKFKAGRWPENPNGWELALQLQTRVGDDSLTFKANVPAHKAVVIAKLWESAGLDAPSAGQRIDERQLVDRSVEVEIEHYKPEGGENVFPVVRRWLPPGTREVDPPGLPPASELGPAAKAKPARKKAEERRHDQAPDDIPF